MGAALKSNISGSNLIELPIGADIAALKEAFIEANPKRVDGMQMGGLTSLPAGAGVAGKALNPVPEAKVEKPKELTEEQKAAIKAAGLEV